MTARARMRMGAWCCGSMALVCAFAGGAGAEASGEQPAGGRLKGFADREGQPAKAELIAEHASLQPGGKTRVGVSFELEEGWHIYAKEPGDAGLPTKIAWSGPRLVTFGPLIWPVAQEFNEPGHIKTFGYSGAVVLASDLRLSPQAKAGQAIHVSAKVEWLSCKEICLPGSAQLELWLPVTEAAPNPSTHGEFFDHTG